MQSNREVLDYLFETGQIDLRRGAIFDRPPHPLPADLDFDRVEGMLLGLAIGDALGNTSESLLPERRRARHGEIRDYLPNPYAGGQPVGLPSDDTQLAFWTLEQMLADGGFNPEHVAARFCRGQIFGVGRAVASFVDCYRAGGRAWYACGPESAGNGALMRIAPMLVPHLRSATAELWVDTALSAMITHNDAGSIACCLAFVAMLWRLLGMQGAPQPGWWLETYVEVARDLEGDKTYRPRGGPLVGYRGSLWRFVEKHVSDAYARGLSVLEACREWHSGAYLLETMPSVITILMRHGHELEQGMLRAVNDTKDNDTIAAIVGAALGALHGEAGLPARWLANLPGRTAHDDDGHIYALLEGARHAWGAA